MNKVSIIIPAYNEAPTLHEAIRRVQEVDLGNIEKEIIVVDNNSTDDTYAIASAFPGIRVLTETTQGKGAAVRTGFREASGQILLIQDADLEYDPDDFRALLAPVLEGSAEIVLGVRSKKDLPQHDPLYSLGNWTITTVTNVLYNVSAEEHTGGYKVYLKRLVDPIVTRTNDFAYETELVCKLLKRGHSLKTVPIRYTRRPYSAGKKINWKDGFKILWAVIKYRFKD